MFRIVTIDREYACGGAEIAAALASRLGWTLWDERLTNEIARLARCPKAAVEEREERTDPFYYRLLKSFLRGSYEGSLNAHKLGVVDSETIFQMTEKVVQHAAAKEECVIVGRGSQYFLAGRTDTFRVFLYAPREVKLRTLVARGVDERQAEALVDEVDDERAQFIQKYFKVEWPNRAVYHAMLNTAVGSATVVEAIAGLMSLEY